MINNIDTEMQHVKKIKCTSQNSELRTQKFVYLTLCFTKK